uniref:Uncharacterized protein n=1 Tax=Alexandrium monilatum TaxID=311494 RepID=A0A7S4W1Q0_9DINO
MAAGSPAGLREQPAASEQLAEEAAAARSHAFFDFEDLEESRPLPVYVFAAGPCTAAGQRLCGRYAPSSARPAGQRRCGARPSGGRQHYARHEEADRQQGTLVLEWRSSGGSSKLVVLEERSGRVLGESAKLGDPWLVHTLIGLETELNLRAVEAASAPCVPQALPRAPLAAAPVTLRARVVCLPERKAAASALLEQLEALGREGPVRVSGGLHPAWDTRGLDGELLKRMGLVSSTCPEAGDKLLGCALSHSQLWAELAESGKSSEQPPGGMLLVLEDDAVLNVARPVPEMLAVVLQHAADHDLLLLGAAADEEWSEDCCENKPASWVSELLVRIKVFMGFWGYVMTARGARRALYALWGEPDEPWPLQGDCDVMVSEGCAGGLLDAVLCVPNLVLHPGGGRMRCSCVGYEYAVRHDLGAEAHGSAFSARTREVRRMDAGATRESEVQALLARCRDLAARREPPPGVPGQQPELLAWLREKRLREGRRGGDLLLNAC